MSLDKKTPIELLEVIRNIIDFLMIKQNVPATERKEFTDKILERKMSDLFSWADGMDIQKERRKTAKAEARASKAEEEAKQAQDEAKQAQDEAKQAQAELQALKQKYGEMVLTSKN